MPHRAAPTPPNRVGLVIGLGGFGDRGLNDGAYAGLRACGHATGAHVSAVAPGSPQDGEAQLILFATENYDEIVTLGSAMAGAVDSVARRFPERHFTLVDGIAGEPNVESVTFKVQEGAFLAGALAALVAKGRTVAFLGGVPSAPVRAYESGFLAGVRNTSPATHTTERFIGSFRDDAAARAAARSLLAGGAAVVFVVAGPAGFGAIDEARRAHAYAIGADADQDAVAPGVVLTSVTKHVAAAVARTCDETVSRKPASGIVALGLAQDGVGLTHFARSGAIVGAATIRRIQRIRDAIVAGTIVPPATPQALAAFRRVAVP